MFAAIKARILELDDSEIDPRELSGLIDALQGKLCRVVAARAKRGDHLLTGQSPVSLGSADLSDVQDFGCRSALCRATARVSDSDRKGA